MQEAKDPAPMLRFVVLKTLGWGPFTSFEGLLCRGSYFAFLDEVPFVFPFDLLRCLPILSSILALANVSTTT